MIIMVNKKVHPYFNIPNFGAKKRDRVKDRWRKQRGIDNKKRIKKAFMGAEPTIGYKNPDSLQGMKVNGKRIALVHSTGELEMLIKRSDAKSYDVTIAKAVSARKNISLAELAEKSGLRVTNKAKPVVKAKVEKGVEKKAEAAQQAPATVAKHAEPVKPPEATPKTEGANR